MRIVENVCGEGCLTVIEARWWWLLAMKIADRVPLPLKVWCWFYDHTTETVWQPGHIGEDICTKCGKDRHEEDVPFYRAELVPCETCRDGGESNG